MVGVVTAGFTDRAHEYAAICRLCIGLWCGARVTDKVANKITVNSKTTA
jgi:hypothetical protein